MVFAVQCPEPSCRKYMLVEEEDQGKVIPCLICKTAINVAKLELARNGNKGKSDSKANHHG